MLTSLNRAAVLFALIVAAATDTRAQSLTFTRDDRGAAGSPRAIAAADFNVDGWLDLATAGTGRDSIAILLNDRAGGFRALPDRVLGGGPFDLATGDLNRDAKPDLVVANADANAVDILIGAGDGTFTTSSRIDIAGGNPRGVTVADFNGDGKLDIIVTEFATGAWRVLYGDGNGSIARQDRFGGVASPQGVIAADFNRDGRIDVAMAGAGINLVAIFYTQPGGGIAQKNVTVGGAVNVLTFGDYNGDGWLDLSAASSSNSTIYTLIGSASGLAWRNTTPTGASPRGIAAVDVNKDGTLDLITADRASSTVSVHLGSGSGTFGSPVTFAAGAGSRAVASGDFDHDGRVDLATANEFGNSTTILTNSTPFVHPGLSFRLQPEPPIDDFSGSDTLLADLNHNGRLDRIIERGLVVLDDGTRVRLDAPFGRHPAVADFNADGHPDLAFLEVVGKRVRVFLGDGRGGFGPARTITGAWGEVVQDMVVGDMNGDGRADLLVTGYETSTLTATLHVMFGRGDATFGPETTTSLPSAIFLLRLADLDRDGRLDVVAVPFSAGTPRLYVLIGDGRGAFSRTDEYTLPHQVSDLEIEDVNEDGRPDLVGATFDSILVLLGTGGGRLELSADYPTAAYRIALGDIDDDGHLDIISNAVGPLGGLTGVWLGAGDGTFVETPGFAFYSPSPTVTDMNHDGILDILPGDVSAIALGERRTTNRPPVADAGSDITISYRDVFNDDEDSQVFIGIDGHSADPDLHALTYEWRDPKGNIIGRGPFIPVPRFVPGTYTLTLRVLDGRGGSDDDQMILTITPIPEIVLHTVPSSPQGNWTLEQDPTAASGVRAFDPDRGAPKVSVPLANPANYVDIWFVADPTQEYKLWVRGKAQNDSWANDSAWIQFDSSLNASGAPAYRIGTTSALPFNLEECSGCGVAGWGWEDDGWGAVDRNGVTLRFEGGRQRLRIQTREDGLSVDQIVLSAQKYKTTRPGKAKNDATILPRQP